ncbi:MAG: 1-deoxy-D-xylulose-5-phosphate synthase N-terminal domain-containing protein [Sphaerochaetaceae bacterium]|nr:1-deoxy-D-xylulose-5-phosphate synthase N-terminal domain-containing protein [Sphaerochaetaceae bacterium]
MTESAKRMRKRILEVSSMGHDGNLQSCFSAVEILRVLYDCFFVGASVVGEEKNFFVLSKGQANLALLVLLAEQGYFPDVELDTFGRFGSKFSMQSDRLKVPGITVSAGSLGHGICQAVGLAWGLRLQGATQHVYCLVGDGELNEGTVWESLIFAASEKLTNFTLVVDDNASIGSMIGLDDFKKKFEAFGCRAYSVDGHDESALTYCLSVAVYDKPVVIIAKTVRGYGCPTLMGDKSWFHRAPSVDELEILKHEVDQF